MICKPTVDLKASSITQYPIQLSSVPSKTQLFSEMPSAVSAHSGSNATATTRCVKPIVYSGSLDKYEQADLTPVIGREFYGLQVADLLRGDDQSFRDLAATSMFTLLT